MTAGYLGYFINRKAEPLTVNFFVGEGISSALTDGVFLTQMDVIENPKRGQRVEIVRARFDAAIRSMQSRLGLPVGVDAETLDELERAMVRGVGL